MASILAVREEREKWGAWISTSRTIAVAQLAARCGLPAGLSIAGLENGSGLCFCEVPPKMPVAWSPGKLEGEMISGAHVVVYSKNAEADRAFFRDVLGFKSVDAGHGWLIFALPPAEAAFHPSDKHGPHELYFLCDNVKTEIATLAKKGVKCSEVHEERWGSITKMRLPGGGEVGLYQPKHPTALGLGAD